MKTTVNSTATIKNITPAQVFPVANKIRKANGCTMKEAYAIAKEQLLTEAANVMENPANVVPAANMELHTQLVEKMTAGNVKFTFRNAKGKEITTTGTLIKDRIPTNRIVNGRKTAKDENTQVFYDVRHGVYRSYKKDQIVAII